MGDGEENAVRRRLFVAVRLGSEVEGFGKGENGFVLHDASEALVVLVLERSRTREAVSQDSRCSTLMAHILFGSSVSGWWTYGLVDTHRRASKYQASPLSTIAPLGEQKLVLSLDNPALELLRLSILKAPDYLTTSVSADPLTVEIDV